jgi:hypothetical protein
LLLTRVSIAQTTKPSTQAVKDDFPFRAVFIDDATEKELGPFPYDRAVYARGIRALDKLAPRAIVIVFFLDLPKSSKGDAEYAKAMADSKANIILEATTHQLENDPNPLPARFNWDINIPRGASLIGGDDGWIPLSIFSEHAHAIGFSDFRIAQEAPLLERYKGKPVKSLFTCALEAGFNDLAEIDPAKSFSIAHHKISINSLSALRIDPPAQDKIDSISFVDVLNGKDARNEFKDRVVILGLDSPSAETVDTRIGQIGKNRWFLHMLRSSYEKILASPA